MTITLTPEQQKWLEAEVAAGRIASVEEAVRLAVDLIMPIDITDLSWAKPYLDEARAEIARGEYVEYSVEFTDGGLKAIRVETAHARAMKIAREGMKKYSAAFEKLAKS